MKRNTKIEKMFVGINEEKPVTVVGILGEFEKNRLLSNFILKDEVNICLGSEHDPQVWDRTIYIPAKVKAFVVLKTFTQKFQYTSGDKECTGLAYLDVENRKLTIEMVEELIELDILTGELKTTSKEGLYKYDMQFLGKDVYALRQHMEKVYNKDYTVVVGTSTGTQHHSQVYLWSDNSFDVDFRICVKDKYDTVIRSVRTFANCKTLHNRKGHLNFELDKVQGLYLKPISPVFKGWDNQVSIQ